MSNRPTLFFICFVSFVILFGMGCEQQPVKRVYEETRIVPKKGPFEEGKSSQAGFEHPPISQDMKEMAKDPAIQQMLAGSVASSNLSWQTPDGWTEKPGSGMRVASFITQDADGSIISLSGAAGGIKQNVMRWMGQIDLVLSDEELDQFLANTETYETEEGLAVRIVDFTELQDKNAGVASTLAGIIETKERTVFLKLTGSVKTLAENKQKFLELCQSIKQSNE